MGMPDWWVSDIPHSDTAEYKLWGNGVVLNCVLFIMQNIVDVYDAEGYVLRNNGDRYISVPKSILSSHAAEIKPQ